MEFMDRLAKDPEPLTKITIAEYAEKGGAEGSEVIMWLMMRGALSQKVNVLHQAYYLPSMTPIATMILEEASHEAPAETNEAYLKRINHEWAGMEKLPGTYPFTLDRSVKAYRLNNFLHELIKPEFRKQFLADPEPLFQQYDLTEEERKLVRDRDWIGLIRYGVIFFLLEKMGAVIGTGSYSLIDGSTVRTPGVGVFLADSKRTNMENYGVQPDMLVDNRPEDILAGRDRQLEAAVEELMKQLNGTRRSTTTDGQQQQK
jgi:gallate dioxygenase